ncbi:MAG: FHA domain-containing protein, partial [Planctomycetes bacterium]|nr:FHA domain-containing protein [Planctomycetota bacterium]
MTLRLRVLGGQHHGDVIDFVEPRQIMIGREPTSDIVLGGGNASRRHARINWDGENLMITDLESRNGVTVNEQIMTRQIMLTP